MKYLSLIFSFLLLLIFNIDSFSQNIVSSNINHNSATISFPNTEGQNLNLHIFTQNVDDTIAFFEDFSKLPKTNTSNYLFNSQIALNLPYSYTLVSGCQGRNIYSTYRDTCYFNPNGEFITPFIDLSKSNGSYRIKFYIQNSSTSIKTMNIYQSDSSGNFTNNSTISIPKNSSQQYDAVFSGGTIKNKIKLYSASSDLAIDNFSISYTSIIRTPINSSPISTNNNFIEINSLNPNTTYYCYVEGRTDTISFRTLDKVKLNSASHISPNSAKINFFSTDTISNRKLVIRKKSNFQTLFAEDLFISEYTCADGTNKAIEIFNGTGLDICLKDYSVKFSINTETSISSNDTIFKFSEEDTIKSNSCIVITEWIKGLNTFNNGIFYKDPNLKGYVTVTGNDPISIMKDDNYVDIFGRIGQNPSIGWVSGTGSNAIQTNKTTLRRLPNVNKGIKVNPTGGSNVTLGFPTLGTEWTQIGIVGAYSAATFSDFGKHTMNNACGSFDSLVYEINLGLKDTAYYLDQLEEGSLYEAYLVFEDNTDSILSNAISFKTGVNSRRLSNGSWNDNNWSKGIPTKIDNAIVDCGQTLSINQGVDAVCYNLILKDSLNQRPASFINNGNLSVENKTIIEKDIKGYTANDNGWNLMGVPIDISTSNQDTIGNSFFNPATNDDLYYWQENYTDSEHDGRWINFKDIPSNSGDFFTNSRGYLVSYQNNTKLNFYGDLNNESVYSILNNASLSLPNNSRGWHLCSNPYPFYINTNNLQRLNVSLPSLLDPETSNYNALLEGDSIPPFAGFMVQVSNPINSLNITKEESGTKSLINPNIITINVLSSIGSDKTRLILRDSASMDYDIRFDNRKLAGYSLSPEIFSVSNNEKYSVNAIPQIADSLIMSINFISKSDNIYTITLDIDNGEDFEKIALYDKISNTELIDFKTDSSYYFYSPSGNNSDMFVLKIFKNLSSLNEIKIEEGISIKQSGDMITVSSNSKIKTLELRNIKGQTINKNSNSNSIQIPHKGVFILRVSTLNHIYNHKIINL